MKKIFAIILSVLMCFGLAACSGGGSTEQASSEPKELKLVDSGYSYIDGYIYYSVVVENPNENLIANLPTVRITARDANGNVLGTSDAGFMSIYPNQTAANAFLGFECSTTPSTVDFELIPQDSWANEDGSLYPGLKELSVTGINASTDPLVGWPSFSGEIVNSNEFDISSAAVTVVFKDSNGKNIGGYSTYVDNVLANSNTPFTLDVITNGFQYSSYDIYATPWL